MCDPHVYVVFWALIAASNPEASCRHVQIKSGLLNNSIMECEKQF